MGISVAVKLDHSQNQIRTLGVKYGQHLNGGRPYSATHSAFLLRGNFCPSLLLQENSNSVFLRSSSFALQSRNLNIGKLMRKSELLDVLVRRLNVRRGRLVGLVSMGVRGWHAAGFVRRTLP